jgi:hypothetical protein
MDFIMKKIFACMIGIGFVAILYGQPRQFRGVQNNIGLVASMCADDELIVDVDGWKLRAVDFIEKGYIPVCVHITNMSNQMVSICEGSIPYKKPDLSLLILCFKYLERKNVINWATFRQMICMGPGAISFVCGMIRNVHGHHEPIWIKVFLLGFLCAALNVCVLTPYDLMVFENRSKKLGDALRNTLPVGSVAVTAGLSAKKIFLIPEDAHRSFECKVFHEYTDTAVATFVVSIF